MTEQQIIDFLSNNLDYFIPNDLVLTIFRTIGWWLVELLNMLLDFCRFLYDKTFALVNITEWTVLEEFLREYNPLIKAIMVFSMVILGYVYIIGKNKQNDLLVSVLIFMVVITASNELFATFNSFAVMFKDAVVGDEGVMDGYALVNQNLYDLIYIDEQIGLAQMDSSQGLPQYPNLTENDMNMIDITEILKNDEEGLTDQAKDILGKKLEYRQTGGELDDVYSGLLWTDFMNEYYYRYKFNYGTYYLAALAAIIVFLGVSYKNVRIMWELLNSRILANLFSGDLSSKKKIVKILEGIRDGYYALCFTAVTLRCYFLVADYITDQIRDNGIARGIIMLFAAYCAIDGANIMERITGVDAGLSSMTGKLIAGMHMARSAAMGIQQARQMGHLKRQSKAMEAMKQTGGAIAGANQAASSMDGMDNANQTGTGAGADTGTDRGAAPGAAAPSDTEDAAGASGTESGMNQTDVHTEDSSNSMDSSMETMQERSETDSNLDGGMGAGTDDNFRQMDDDIGRNDGNNQMNDGQGENPDIRYNGRGDEKGMFERWADKPQSPDRMQQKSSLHTQPKPPMQEPAKPSTPARPKPSMQEPTKPSTPAQPKPSMQEPTKPSAPAQPKPSSQTSSGTAPRTAGRDAGMNTAGRGTSGKNGRNKGGKEK